MLLSEPGDWSKLVRNVRWGVLTGWCFAALFSLWVLGLALLQGSARFEKYGMSAWGIMLTYFAAATIGGMLVGALRPFARTRWGGAVVGAFAGICVYTAIGVAADGWANFDPWFALVGGIPVGGFCGYRFAGKRSTAA